jgi:hypothetical protein
MATLIGLCGIKGSGKDTVCEMIQDLVPNTKRFACADLLKMELHKSFGLSLEILHGTQEQKDVTKTQFSWDHPMLEKYALGRIGRVTYRELTQVYGTEIVRSARGEDYWINQILDQVYAHEGLSVITDIRFDNEAEQIPKKNLWYIDGDVSRDQTNHASETLDFEWDRVIKGKGKATLEETRLAIMEALDATKFN